jgi:hypothetical protein
MTDTGFEFDREWCVFNKEGNKMVKGKEVNEVIVMQCEVINDNSQIRFSHPQAKEPLVLPTTYPPKDRQIYNYLSECGRRGGEC